ncbi:MAG: 50S ribosomal protein L21 [Pseudomonadota bacterium]
MIAVIKTGGKQYRVAEEQVLTVEKLDGEAGSTLVFDQVLMVGDGDNTTLGTPLVEGASVAAELLEQNRADKIVVFKKKRRKDYRRKAGHRQHQTVVRITEILTDGKAPGTKAKAKPKKAKAEAPAADEAPVEAPAEAPAETETKTEE